MTRKTLLFISLTAMLTLLVPFKAKSATLIGCNTCSASQMQNKAETKARWLGVGRHEIAILNYDSAQYEVYQVDALKVSGGSGKNTRWRFVTEVLYSSIKTEVEYDLRKVKSTIAKIKDGLSSDIQLPPNSVYQSASDALIDGPAFGTWLTNYLNNQQSFLNTQTQLLRATLQKLADNLQVGASVVVSVSTTLGGSQLGATVIFPDSTSMEIKLNFVSHLSDGLQLEVAITNNAKLADGVTSIPLTRRQAKGFSAREGNANMNSLKEWLTKIGMRGNGGGGSCKVVSADCTSNICTYKYRCS
jgi:hypothetical protein